jgi:glycosyltransferase involved in cell wall biosynthesis
MKVLLTHELFAPDYRGGGELLVLKTAQHLKRSGVSVRVLTTGDARLTQYDGIPTRRLPVHRYCLNLAVREIAEEVREADLIQTFSYHACLPSLLAGLRVSKPVVCMVMGLFADAWLEMRGPVAGRLWRSWERFLLRRKYSRMVFLSEFSRALGVTLGADPNRSVVNSPGIDHDLYVPREKEDVVLFVGKLEARKGVYDILAAAKALPDVRFRMIGWGPEEIELQRAAPPNLEVSAWLEGPALREAFAQARIFVLPSRAETFGIALLEAMASGCAVISTVPAVFAGAALTTGDKTGLVEAIQRLWSDRDETERLGKKNAELAREYTWERYTHSLLRIYDAVLASTERALV